MSSGKILLSVSKNLHIALKTMAMKNSLTLNETCVRILEGGVGAAIEAPIVAPPEHKKELKIEINMQDTLEAFKPMGLIAILKTEGYVADYVLVFHTGVEIPEKVQSSFDKIVQAVKIPDSKHAPSTMWIQIAQSQEVIWYIDEEIQSELLKKFDAWS